MIVCIKLKHWKISKLNEVVFMDQNGHMVPDKVKAVSFRRDVILVNRFSEAHEEGIASKDMLCLVENTSVRVIEELEIEEETFFYQQAFILNSRDQIREADRSTQRAVLQKSCSTVGILLGKLILFYVLLAR